MTKALKTKAGNLPQLTASERSELRELESRVQAGISIVHKVGSALAEINAKRLYRETHKTFAAYCRERWGFGKSHAYRAMEAAAVVEAVAEVSPIGGQTAPLPNERQARALARLPTPDLQRAAWKREVEQDHKPSSASIDFIAKKALASFSAEDRKAIIEDREKDVLDPAAEQAEDREQLLGRIRRLGVKLLKLVKRHGDLRAAERHMDKFDSLLPAA